MTVGLSRKISVVVSAMVFVASLVVMARSYSIWKSAVSETAAIEREPAVTEGHAAAKSTPSGESVQFELDEVVSDLAPSKDEKTHSLSVHLELELFDDGDRTVIEKASGGLKDTIVSLIRAQTVENLASLSGKLYFKESLVSKMNTFLNQPVVRDIHFSSFLIK
jgi:flagellar basal body-associated protein FliL